MQAVQQFLSKFAMDVLRTALASAFCALLFAHQWSQSTPPAASQATVAQATATTASLAAGEQAVQMIRDEHNLVTEYLKAEQAKERAAIEKEVREANAAKIQQATQATPTVRQAEIEPRKSAPATRPIPPRVAAAESVPATSGAAMSAPVGAANTPASPVVVAALPPPVILAPPGSAAPTKIDPPRETTESFGQKVVAATHVNDVVSFARDVSGWFKHEEAPVPPAEVRLSPFVNAEM
jgi:hypothetical protein